MSLATIRTPLLPFGPSESGLIDSRAPWVGGKATKTWQNSNESHRPVNVAASSSQSTWPISCVAESVTFGIRSRDQSIFIECVMHHWSTCLSQVKGPPECHLSSAAKWPADWSASAEWVWQRTNFTFLGAERSRENDSRKWPVRSLRLRPTN